MKKNIKIGLNATCYNSTSSGARQRFVGLYSAFFEIMAHHSFVIYEPFDFKVRNLFKNYPNVKFIKTVIPSYGRLRKFFLRYNWSKYLNKEDFDVFENFNIPSIINKNSYNLHTLHDIRGISNDSRSFLKPLYKIVHNKSLYKNNKIITVSECMKNEILNYFPLLNISVIHNGIDLINRDIDINDFKNKFISNSKFIFSLGHLEERKNYVNLILGYKIMKDQGTEYSLIIAGKDIGMKKKLTKLINKFNLQNNVLILTNLNDDQVKLYFNNCSLFVFPSKYEGFGIPILESMLHNKPFITSDILPFKEITENTLNYFSPDSPASIANNIINLLKNTEQQEKIISYSKSRIKHFDYNNLAFSLYDIYKEKFKNIR